MTGDRMRRVDEAVRESTARGYGRLVDYVETVSGADRRTISRFFAKGILMNVLAAMDYSIADEPNGHGLSVERYYCDRWGVEVRHPMRDRRVVELFLSVPAEDLGGVGISRPIMRRMGTPRDRPRTTTVSVCVPTASAR